MYFGCYTRFPSQPCADRKLLLTEALRRHCGVPRSAGFDHAQELDPVGPGQARALAPPPSRLTTGSLRTLGRVRRRGRGGGRGGGGGGGDACRAHGQSHRTSVCLDRRGESGRHLLLGSLRALPALGRLLRTRSAPRPQPWGSDSAAAVCV